MDEELRRHIDERFNHHLEQLSNLIRHPSVSATGLGVNECAEYLSSMMESLGINCRVYQGKHHPIIVGSVNVEEGQPCLLVYDHYDVQPPDPLEEWSMDPFSGRIDEQRVYGRGASDSKANLLSYLFGVCALRDLGRLSIGVKFLFEGEEEIGSPHLEGFAVSHKDELAADAVVCCDGELDASGRPTVTLGMKGLLYVELRCRATSRDAHSSMAPILPSAPWRLVCALKTLRGGDGEILIPGWREGLVEPGRRELDMIAKIPWDEGKVREEYGVSAFLRGLSGPALLKQLLYEPTCNIAGLSSGYEGEGSKTVLPSTAMAKLDFRLVYDQDPNRCLSLLRRHLDEHGFADVEIRQLGMLEPSHTDPDAPIARACREAAVDAYGCEAVVYPKNPASGPDYVFTKRLGLDSVWTGCAPAFGGAHSPNEFIGIEDFRRGIVYASRVVELFSTQVSGGR